MNTISSRDARRTFSDVLSRVAYRKERITVTKNGKPTAVFVPVEDAAILEAMDDRIVTEGTKRRTKVKPFLPGGPKHPPRK